MAKSIEELLIRLEDMTNDYMKKVGSEGTPGGENLDPAPTVGEGTVKKRKLDETESETPGESPDVSLTQGDEVNSNLPTGRDKQAEEKLAERILNNIKKKYAQEQKKKEEEEEKPKEEKPKEEVKTAALKDAADSWNLGYKSAESIFQYVGQRTMQKKAMYKQAALDNYHSWNSGYLAASAIFEKLAQDLNQIKSELQKLEGNKVEGMVQALLTEAEVESLCEQLKGNFTKENIVAVTEGKDPQVRQSLLKILEGTVAENKPEDNKPVTLEVATTPQSEVPVKDDAAIVEEVLKENE